MSTLEINMQQPDNTEKDAAPPINDSGTLGPISDDALSLHILSQLATWHCGFSKYIKITKCCIATSVNIWSNLDQSHLDI